MDLFREQGEYKMIYPEFVACENTNRLIFCPETKVLFPLAVVQASQLSSCVCRLEPERHGPWQDTSTSHSRHPISFHTLPIEPFV